MKEIKVVGSGIVITVENSDDMYKVFSYLHSCETLELDGKIYPRDSRSGYTRGYWAKYMGEQ